jgi:hypothetical protein
MTNLPGTFSAGLPANNESEFVRQASLPLYQARGWMKFVGIMMILGGIPSLITLVGIIPIWQGILLMQAASSIETAATTGQGFAYHSAMGNLKTFFVINGVLFLIGIVFALLALCIAVVLPIVGISLIPSLNPSNW